MRRKPTSGGGNGGGYNNNQQRRPRYPGAGDGQQRSQNNGGGHNRPRKNYSANREKYLAQARDALAAGDRVLAENYFQHADHCYRMMVEEGYNNPRPQQHAPQQGDEQQQEQAGDNQGNDGQGNQPEEQAPENTNVLPAFLTVPFAHGSQPSEPPATQNWEERDA